MIGLPLVYWLERFMIGLWYRSVQTVGLLTEKSESAFGVRFWVCTVESVPLEKRFRLSLLMRFAGNKTAEGHVFTDRILSRGTIETWFLGSDIMGACSETRPNPLSL